MKISRISRRTFALRAANEAPRPRAEIIRTIVAVTLAIGLIGTGAIALPSLAPVEAGLEIPPRKGPQLEPQDLADIESIRETAGMLGSPLKETVSDIARALPSTAAKVARATTAVTKPIADGIEGIPASIVRATAHEAIKMKKGDLRNLFIVIGMGGFWALILRLFVFGEMFGIPFHRAPLAPPAELSWAGLGLDLPLEALIHKAFDVADMIYLSILFATLHLGTGFIFGFVNEVRHNKKHAIGKIGFLLVLIGVFVLLPESRWLRKKYAALKRRFPRLFSPIESRRARARHARRGRSRRGS